MYQRASSHREQLGIEPNGDVGETVPDTPRSVPAEEAGYSSTVLSVTGGGEGLLPTV